MAILKRKQADLRLCGSVALSSALLYRFKVETIFYFERLRAGRIEHPRDEPPSIIVLPFRYELYSTSIDDLVASLETILNEALQSRQKEKAKKLEPEPEVEIDQYIIKIEEMVRDFRAKLTRSLRNTGDTLFSKLIDGVSASEKAKTFILLLFVATEGIVKLAQEGNDIRITMVI